MPRKPSSHKSRLRFREVVLKRWEDIEALEFEWSGHIFRGQSNADWSLDSSVQRLFKRIQQDQPLNGEHWLLYEFKRRAHLYIECPDDDDILSWLALMQHHGAPTRLLDFTYSFYVACFFALIDTAGDSAVWSINEVWLRSLSTCVATANCGRESAGLRDDDYELINSFANEYLYDLLSRGKRNPDLQTIIPAVLTVEPFRQVKRMATQQGVFLMPADIERGFLDNIKRSLDLARKTSSEEWEKEYYSDIGSNIKKYVLPNSMRDTGLAYLKQMNITYETLFPGIDGFARSLVHTVAET